MPIISWAWFANSSGRRIHTKNSRFVEEATAGDYEHLLATAKRYCPALVLRKGERPYDVEARS